MFFPFFVSEKGGSHHQLGDLFVEKTYDGMTLLLTMHVSGAQSVVYEVLQYLRCGEVRGNRSCTVRL